MVNVFMTSFLIVSVSTERVKDAQKPGFLKDKASNEFSVVLYQKLSLLIIHQYQLLLKNKIITNG